jgi:hypothetical protein
MAKRDPNKTARNKKIEAIKAQRRTLQPQVFAELVAVENGKYCNEASLNAFIGSKTEEYIALKEAVISGPHEYASKWLQGLQKKVEASKLSGADPRHQRMWDLIKGKQYPNFKRYLGLFLESSFLKHYEEHYKAKPKIEESEYWFGNNDDEFGLLVTPRFAHSNWENDKSEIRHFSQPYWTLAHLMETGLCYMGENKKRKFTDLGDYLQFFRDMVRRTKSQYQLDIADRYIAYVESHAEPMSIPMLIPELRYDPFKTKHEHRLDFLIINPWSLKKSGFEVSPWSSHGQLKGADKPLAEHNRDAKAHFEREMEKHKKYWRKFGIAYVTYTDADLKDMDAIWEEINQHLEIGEPPDQLELAILHQE